MSRIQLFVLWCSCVQTVRGFSCLPDPIPLEKRRNITVAGKSMHLISAKLTWTSGSLMHEAARIVLQEKVGYNVDFAQVDVPSSRLMYHQLADCNGTDAAKPCVPLPSGSVVHFGFEVWESYALGMREKLTAEVPDRVPMLIGDLGAKGTEAYFVRDSALMNASKESVFLKWYESFNIARTNASKYFDSHVDLPEPDTSCEAVTYMKGGYLDEYVRLLKDPDFTMQGGKKVRNCHKGWALSPACRKLMQQGQKGCIPGISYGGWGAHDLAQKAAWFGMPLAIGSFNWGLYVSLPKKYETLMYWWTPDGTFMEKTPAEVIFPAYDPDEHSQNIYKTAMLGTKLFKLASVVIAEEVQFLEFFKRLVFSIGTINKLVASATGNSRPDEDIACEWVKKNTKIWEAWVPDPTNCIRRQGLMDFDGNFVTNKSLAAKCEFCSPGRHSLKITTKAGSNHICAPCAKGSAQSKPGETECTMCVEGEFADAIGQIKCSRCAIGDYSSTLGATECTSCAKNLSLSTTQFMSAGSPKDCKCSLGTYHQQTATTAACVVCGGGQLCDKYGMAEPLQKAGFYVQHSASSAPEYSTYRCRNRKECPSGIVGTCGAGRGGLACGGCIDDHFPASAGTCDSCSGSDLMPIILTVFFMLACSVGLYVHAKADISQKHVSSITATLAIGQLACAVQALGVFVEIDIPWEEPIYSLMKMMKFFTFELDVIKIQCVFKADNPVTNFLCTLLVFPIFMGMLAGVLLITRALGKGRVSLNSYINAAGLVGIVIYISLTIAVLRPLHCLESPNGTMSMATNPSVMCWDSSQHTTLVALGIIGVLAYPCTILGAVAQITWRYPALVASGSGLKILDRYRFLFQRFSPKCYYWGVFYLTRNFLISVSPALFQSAAIWQVISINILMLCSLVGTSYLTPWRTIPANIAELTTTLGLAVFMQVAAFFVEAGTHMKEKVLGSMLVGIVALVLLFCVAILCAAVYKRLVPNKFSMFLCHHKEGAASLSRYIKMLVTRVTSGSVFLDSDQLEELDLIFDTVRATSRNLVLLATKMTLDRPWCAGEITTAKVNNIPIVPVACDDYVAPNAEALGLVGSTWSEQQKFALSEYGITVDSIKDAYQHVVTIETIKLDRFAQMEKQDEVFFEMIKRCGLSIGTMKSVKNNSTGEGARMVVAGCVWDPETRCTCEVLRQMVQTTMNVPVDVAYSAEDVTRHLPTADYLVVLLTRGLLQDAVFSGVLVKFEQARQAEPVDMVTILADTNFVFPGPEFYAELESSTSQDSAPFAAGIRRMLNILALPFSPHGSWGMMTTQSSEICRRFRRCQGDSVGYTLSSIPIKATTEELVEEQDI